MANHGVEIYTADASLEPDFDAIATALEEAEMACPESLGCCKSPWMIQRSKHATESGRLLTGAIQARARAEAVDRRLDSFLKWRIDNEYASAASPITKLLSGKILDSPLQAATLRLFGRFWWTHNRRFLEHR